jgi:peptidylprolyl isomerase
MPGPDVVEQLRKLTSALATGASAAPGAWLGPTAVEGAVHKVAPGQVVSALPPATPGSVTSPGAWPPRPGGDDERGPQVSGRRRSLQMVLPAGLAILAVGVAVLIVFAVNLANPSPAASPTVGTGPTSAKPITVATADALRRKPTVVKGTGTLTTLKTTTLIEGTGPATVNGETLSVNYVGVNYATGAEFDSSWSRNQPFTFQLGAGNVIPGWDKGLLGVKIGSRVQLDIPANLAYPGTTSGPTSGALRFVVDILSATPGQVPPD